MKLLPENELLWGTKIKADHHLHADLERYDNVV